MTTGSAIRHFTLDLDDLEWTGNDLVRPESVVAEPDGTLWASDARGGATRIDPGGGQSFLGGWGGEPNGLAIDPSGDLVTANIALGLVQRMTRPAAGGRARRPDRRRRHLRDQRGPAGPGRALSLRGRDDEGPHPALPGRRRRVARRTRGVRPGRPWPRRLRRRVHLRRRGQPVGHHGGPQRPRRAGPRGRLARGLRGPARGRAGDLRGQAPGRHRRAAGHAGRRRPDAPVPDQRVLRGRGPADRLRGIAGHAAAAHLPLASSRPADEPLAVTSREGPRVVVVGGGLVGSSAAYQVACQGGEAVLVDRQDQGQATAAGAGILSPGNRFEGGDADLLGLVRVSVAWYPELLARLAEDGEVHTGYETVGALHVATTEQEADRLADLLAELLRRRQRGFSHVGDAELVDARTARAGFPALGPVRAAIHIPGAARVDGRLLRDALHRALRRRGGTTLQGGAELLLDRERKRATGVTVGDRTLSADAVIVAGGAWSGALADSLGVSLPVAPQRGQIAHLALPGVATGAWPIVLGFHSHYLLTFPPNRVVAGATREHGTGYDHRVTAAGMHEVLGEALRVAPGLNAATVQEVRVGFRPASPDGRPILGRAPGIRGLFFATGHGPYGLQVGPWSGAAVADLALGRPVPLDLGAFSVDRFHPGGRGESVNA